MKTGKKQALVDCNYCVGCGCCVKACPRGAVSVPEGIYAEVMAQKCVGCGLCARACPASAISIIQREEGERRVR